MKFTTYVHWMCILKVNLVLELRGSGTNLKSQFSSWDKLRFYPYFLQICRSLVFWVKINNDFGKDESLFLDYVVSDHDWKVWKF
jgi:hypothetical protein